MTCALTMRQQQRYVDDGLVFPIPVLSPDSVERYRGACDELESKLGGKPRTIEVRQMHLHFGWAYELATHPAIVAAVSSVLGPNLFVWATELFSKHPRDGAISIGWHRDRPYMGFDPETSTTAWIALSDCTAANGCMQALPGPDRREIERGDREPINVELKAGEMSLHDSEILHGSNPNDSDVKRVGFAIRFVTPEARPLAGDPPDDFDRKRGYDPKPTDRKDHRPPVIRASGNGECPHFQLADPPDESYAERSLAKMKHSATRHLDTILANLSQAGS